MQPKRRLVFIAFAGVSLLTGLWIGLARLGWAIPPLRPAAHGPLMISGFLGVVISLERAAAFKRPWAYGAPLLAGLGGLALIAGLPFEISAALFTAASGILIIAFAVTYYDHYRLKIEWAGLTLIAGAGLWGIGNLLWLAGEPLSRVAPWWVGFLVVTIAGERLELARVLLHQSSARITFLLSAALFSLGLLVSLFAFGFGLQVGGAGLAALGVWLLIFDVARRTIRQTGLPRFIAACLLPGYVWLSVAGVFWMLWGPYFAGGPYYDAMLHTILLGFVFSMIFGHEPIILPAVLGAPIVYRPAFYVHLVLLHLSVLVRVVGDLAAQPALRMWGGMFNVVAILAFIVNTVIAVRLHLASQVTSNK
ncbi:MAG TPA: hypothetical protein VI547_14415 [Anaerolineales bacterium]|nr:hypothetical protein [Anaerolineales bacterium]